MTKTTFRNFIDLDSSGGDSFWGLRRTHARTLALVVMFIGLMLADPPAGLLPNDFMNIFVAGQLFKIIPSLSMELWLLLSYTIIAWGLILFGAYIYPYNTRKILNGVIFKITRAIKKAVKNPLIVIVSLIIFYFVFQWYKLQIIG